MSLLIFEPIFEFSRQNCVSICAFLVPANLLTTITVLVLLFTESSLIQIRLATVTSVVFASTLFLHISTWFIIGVITPVTFILFALGTTCLAISLLANIYRHKLLEIKFFSSRYIFWDLSTEKIKNRFN